MAIGSAVQRGSTVYVYDERGKQLASISAGDQKKGDGLLGYTAGTVTIKRGSIAYSYNEKGSVLSSVSVR